MAKRASEKTASIPRSELGTVAFDRIHRSPLNPRTKFPAKGIADLAATIEQEGLLEALTVRPAPALDLLEGLSEHQVRSLLAALVANRVGSPAIPDDDATLVAGLARKGFPSRWTARCGFAPTTSGSTAAPP